MKFMTPKAFNLGKLPSEEVYDKYMDMGVPNGKFGKPFTSQLKSIMILMTWKELNAQQHSPGCNKTGYTKRTQGNLKNEHHQG
jgi:hypothetical protein